VRLLFPPTQPSAILTFAAYLQGGSGLLHWINWLLIYQLHTRRVLEPSMLKGFESQNPKGATLNENLSCL